MSKIRGVHIVDSLTEDFVALEKRGREEIDRLIDKKRYLEAREKLKEILEFAELLKTGVFAILKLQNPSLSQMRIDHILDRCFKEETGMDFESCVNTLKLIDLKLSLSV